MKRTCHSKTVVRGARLALAVALSMLAAGCGTMATRLRGFTSNSDTDFIGWPLFEAVPFDWWWIRGGDGSCKLEAMQPVILPFLVLSLPVDLGVDIVLAPFDVVAGLLGWSRYCAGAEEASCDWQQARRPIGSPHSGRPVRQED